MEGEWLNALGQPDPYQPTYVARFFPEYFGTALTAESFIRDMAPLTTRYVDIFGEEHAHGRKARLLNGQVAPVAAWITEVGIAPRQDGFAFLPFQVNAQRFVIPYYVMTNDLTQELGQEEFSLQLSGVDGKRADVTVYDPLHDQTISFSVNQRTDTTLDLTLTATDAPYLLILDEASTPTGSSQLYLPLVRH